MRIGIAAGEASGDLLAAGLIRAIKARYPEAHFEGVAGPAMIEAGCEARYPMERLSVMGFVEVLGRYRELKGMQTELGDYFCQNPPDVFIGVDAPDFNLAIERRLKTQGIKAVHYVSPSVWAWRQYRVKKIARSVDLILTLFPFEARFYEEHQVPVRFVGHPLADMIPLQADRTAARQALGLAAEGELVALLPGSRMKEVTGLARTMLEAAAWLVERRPGVRFAVPLATEATRRAFDQILIEQKSRTPDLDVHVFDGGAREVMAASDAVLVASGTATLEALLLKKPMVVTYRLAALSYWLAKRLLKTPYVSLPNVLAKRGVVQELIQDAATPEALGAAILGFLESPETAEALQGVFDDIHRGLRLGASDSAAEAVLALIGK